MLRSSYSYGTVSSALLTSLPQSHKDALAYIKPYLDWPFGVSSIVCHSRDYCLLCAVISLSLRIQWWWSVMMANRQGHWNYVPGEVQIMWLGWINYVPTKGKLPGIMRNIWWLVLLHYLVICTLLNTVSPWVALH